VSKKLPCMQCGREAHLLRGLCCELTTPCYGREYRKVCKGITTWEALVTEGKALPRKYPRKKS